MRLVLGVFRCYGFASQAKANLSVRKRFSFCEKCDININFNEKNKGPKSGYILIQYDSKAEDNFEGSEIWKGH